MSSPLSAAIARLSSRDSSARIAAGREIYCSGRALAERAVVSWWSNAELAALLFAPDPLVTVGLAVAQPAFSEIRAANGTPPLSKVPPDQDAEEFELHFPDGVTLDVLTTRQPVGSGAIARYLSKFGEGVQQVEFRCSDVDRATTILGEAFGTLPVYPQARPGADGTRVNFFLVSTPEATKVLIELYAIPEDRRH
jgi:hypothetical protein